MRENQFHTPKTMGKDVLYAYYEKHLQVNNQPYQKLNGTWVRCPQQCLENTKSPLRVLRPYPHMRDFIGSNFLATHGNNYDE